MSEHIPDRGSIRGKQGQEVGQRPVSSHVEPAIRPAPTEEKARLMVLESCMHQPAGREVAAYVSSSFERWLETDEQTYQRVMAVGEEWQHLERGWFVGKKSGLLILKNESTEKESVLELGVLPAGQWTLAERSRDTKPEPAPFARVRPGESCRFEPSGLDSLMIRSSKGECRLNLTLFPV